jgi:ribosomal protein L2
VYKRQEPVTNVTIAKTVTGSYGNKKKEFGFTAYLKDGDRFLTYDTFSLKSGESYTMKNIPAGSIIKIAEADDANYKTTYKDSADADSSQVHKGKVTGEITLGSGERAISFVNDRIEVPVTGIVGFGHRAENVLFLVLLITTLALVTAVKLRRKQLA